MRLLLERQDRYRWIIEFVRSCSAPLPNEKPQLTCIRLTSSNHDRSVEIETACRRHHSRTCTARSTPKAPSLIGGSKSKRERIRTHGEVLQETEPNILPDYCPDPPRKRSLRQRISSISKMLSPCFREHSNNESYCFDAELPGSGVPELEATSRPVELEEPTVMLAWELPAEMDNESIEPGSSVGHHDQPNYGGLGNPCDLLQHHNTTSATFNPYPIARDRGYAIKYTPPQPHEAYMSSSAPTSLNVSPLQGPRRSVSSQHLPIMTNWGTPSYGCSDSNCPSLSPATSLSESPVSPLRLSQSYQYDHPGANTVNPISTSAEALSNIPACLGNHFSSPTRVSPCNTIDGVNTHHLSTVYACDSSNNRAGFEGHLSPTSSANSVGPRQSYTVNTMRNLQARQSISNDTGSQPQFRFDQNLESLAMLPSVVSDNSGSVRYIESSHPSQGTTPIRSDAPSRPQQNAQNEMFDVHSIVRNESGCGDPPPKYIPQVRYSTRMWDTAAANVAQREEQTEASGPRSNLPDSRRIRGVRASITSALHIQPICCDSCGKKFNGRYQKGNWKRHMKQQHTQTPNLFKCRDPVCENEYRREDARRKHEWKKHRIADSRPEKRRKDKRIYMPGMSNTQ